jgi:hypothetical protein
MTGTGIRLFMWAMAELNGSDVTVLDRGEYAHGLTSGVNYQLERCLYNGEFYINIQIS